LVVGTYAAVEHEHVIRNLDIASAVDIGANRGQFSLLLSGLLPSVRIYAFEPLSRPASAFRRLFGTSSRVTLYQEAIGAAEMTTGMYVSRHDDSSSLLPSSALQHEIFPGTESVAEEQVHVVPLDQRLGPQDLLEPALLKLDVQGYELAALRGCESLLNRFAHVYVEISFRELYLGQPLAGEVIEFLNRRGFDPTGIYNVVSDSRGLAVQADCMFERKL
jgi:FkbM family methyltransferase